MVATPDAEPLGHIGWSRSRVWRGRRQLRRPHCEKPGSRCDLRPPDGRRAAEPGDRSRFVADPDARPLVPLPAHVSTNQKPAATSNQPLRVQCPRPGRVGPRSVQAHSYWCPAVVTDRERYVRGVMHRQPVIPRAEPVTQAATRISYEHDFVLAAHAGHGNRRRSKSSILSVRCVQLKLQASGGLHPDKRTARHRRDEPRPQVGTRLLVTFIGSLDLRAIG